MNDVMTDNTFRRLLWYPIFSQWSRVARSNPVEGSWESYFSFSQNLVTFWEVYGIL